MAERGNVLYSRSTDEGSDPSDVWDDTALIEAYDKAISGAYKKIANRRRAADSFSDGLSESNSDAKLVEHGTTSKTKKRVNQSNLKPKKFKVGDYCRAKYNADGLVYECRIKALDSRRGTSIVEFVGYGNTQLVPVLELLPPERRRSVLSPLETLGNGAGRGENDLSSDSSMKQRNSKRSKRKGNKDGAHQVPFLPSESQFPSSAQMPSSGTGSNPMIPMMGCPPPPPPLTMFSGGGEDVEEDETLSAMLMAWYMSGFHTGYYQAWKRAQKARSSMAT